MNWLKCRKPKFPIVHKCCFCIPIRRGVIIFGYVNLVLSLLSLPLLIYLLAEELATGKAVEKNGYMEPLVHLPVTIAFVLIDVAMNIVLLIGAHKKKRILLKVYFYFGVVFELLTLCIDLAYFDSRRYFENTVYFAFLSLDAYILFIIFNTMYVTEESAGVQYMVYRDQQHL